MLREPDTDDDGNEHRGDSSRLLRGTAGVMIASDQMWFEPIRRRGLPAIPTFEGVAAKALAPYYGTFFERVKRLNTGVSSRACG